MKIDATGHAAVKAASAVRNRPAAAPGENTAKAAEGSRPGRRHVQRDLKHLVRDVRHQVKGELHELRASGEADEAKIAAVRGAFHDFRDQVQAAFHDAGRGGSFDAGAMPEGLRQAMISFTEALRALNGTADDADTVPAGEGDGATAPVDEPTDTPDGTAGRTPDLDVTVPAGSLLDLTA